MSKATLTLSQFAQDLGAHSRITRDVSLVWHKQYVKADAVTRKALREEFMTHFIIGFMQCTEKQAMRILITSAPERTADQKKAYEAASQKFLYHISRTGAKSQPAQAQSSKRIAPKVRSAAMDFLAEFEGETLAAQIKAAIAVLNSLK